MNHISFKKFTSAHGSVWRELCALGLSESKLSGVQALHCSLPQITMPLALGFFILNDYGVGKMIGYRAGHIYIPRWVFTSGHFSLRDVIRHEYGHAMAYHCPEAMGGFEKIFGAKYGNENPKRDRDGFISDYAMKDTSEDFAETFMVFARRLGVEKGLRGAVLGKYRFVSKVVQRVVRSPKTK